MKKIFSIALLVSLLFSSCIKEEIKYYNGGDVLEFDAAALNAVAVGVKFPILVRVPVYGFAVATANPSITRNSGSIKFRVNLVGKQSSTNQQIAYRVVTANFASTLDVTSGSGQRLAAIAGTHFTTSGTFTIPANSSYGEIEVVVINPGTGSSVARYLVLEIDGNETLKPSENYKRIGIQISQS